MTDWISLVLGEHSHWSSGGTPPKDGAEFWNGEIPWISASSMKTGRLGSSDRTLTPQGLERGSRLAMKGSVLLLVRGSELHKRIPVGIAEKDVAFNQDVKAINSSGPLSNEYLYYWLVAHEPDLLAKVEPTGIGAGKLDMEVLKQLRINVPRNPEIRDRIVEIAKTLDDKIDASIRMSTTLEEMARAIFKSWFIDFDPVRAKAEGRPTNLPSEIDSLFPDSFEDSELGKIPTGWRATEFAAVSEVFDSKRVPLSSRARAERKGVYPYYGATSVMDHVDDYLFDGVYLLIGEDGSVINPDGTPFLQYVWGKFWVNNHAHVIQGTNGISTEHLLIHLMHTNIGPFITGAVQLKLNQGNMNRIPFLHPGLEIADLFTRISQLLFERIRELEDQTTTLKSMRDSLLPQLLSGNFWVQPL